MPDEPIWTIDQHTRAKHELLRRYLGAWFPILSSSGWHRRVLFLDGFAGPGVYSGGEQGSPLIALATLVDHPHFERLSSTEFVFLFVEADAQRFESLEATVAGFWATRPGGQPANVRVRLYNDQFAHVATEMVSIMREQKKQLAPTLAFIDPFGWSGVPLAVIADLLSFDRCEVLFNFMFDSVNRFVADERPGIERHFVDLFGTEEVEHQAAAVLAGDDRKRFLRDLYMHQLRERGGFRHVRSFELMDVERGRTAYFLMFGTRHPKGLEVMKDAMWALDPVSGTRFTGFAGSQPMLFEPEPNFAPLRVALLQRYAGKTVAIETIERFVIEDTDFKTSHYKRVLKGIEIEDLLTCVSPRARRLTYAAGTVLKFHE